MANSEASFEVEIRCHFDTPEEAYELLPFIRTCLEGKNKVPWATRFYGRKLLQSGQLLRAGEAVHNGKVVHFLGWKGTDRGSFANIRQEVDEDITAGTANSAVLQLLGGSDFIVTPDSLVRELDRLGHREFMSFQGVDLSGYDERFGVKVKLMACPALKWPLLVELEKTAKTEGEASRCEAELRELSNTFQLQKRLVREEPPSLLYAGLFAHQGS